MNKRQKINDIHGYLSEVEDTDPEYYPPELKELADRVRYLHMIYERQFEYWIASYNNLLKKDEPEKQMLVMNWKEAVFDDLGYYHKFKICNKLMDLPKKIKKDVERLNDIRKHFAHPVTYKNKIYSYKDEDMELEILLFLKSALANLNEYIIELNPEMKKYFKNIKR